jgi:cytidylate kinase
MARAISVAIDGPTGAGKTTLARAVAARLGLTYADTGALYRAVGLYARRAGVNPRDAAAVAALLPQVQLSMAYADGVQRVFLNGADVSDTIRSEQASADASDVSALPQVRAFLLDFQRDLARNGVVMEGRDIGTVVLPGADVKIFLTATSGVRAERRWRELAHRRETASLQAIHTALLARDAQDSSRSDAPLRPAADAVFVDATQLTLAMTLDAILAIIKEKTGV